MKKGFVAVGAAVLCMSGSGCSLAASQGTPKTDIVTPSAALVAAKQNYQLDRQASIEGSVEKEKQAEALSALAVDLPGLSPEADQGQFPLKGMRVFATHQTTYPATFLAVVDSTKIDDANKPTAAPLEIVELLRRTSATETWKIVWYAYADPAKPLQDISLDAAGFATAATGGQLKIPPADVRARLDAFSLSSLQGRPSPDGALFGDTVHQVITHEGAHEAAMKAKGYRLEWSFDAPTDQPETITFQTKSGGALVFFVDEMHRKVSTDPGYCVNQDAARKQWGPGLAPGDYGSFDEVSRSMWAMFDPKGATPVDEIGSFSNTTSYDSIAKAC